MHLQVHSGYLEKEQVFYKFYFFDKVDEIYLLLKGGKDTKDYTSKMIMCFCKLFARIFLCSMWRSVVHPEKFLWIGKKIVHILLLVWDVIKLHILMIMVFNYSHLGSILI